MNIPGLSRLILIMLLLFGCSAGKKVTTVYTIGDSTMADKKPEVYPETGWCQVFPMFVNKNIKVRNHAVNGRSTKSFIGEGRWKAVADSLKQGDYVFIQFGHNDQKIQDSTRYTDAETSYKNNLIRFVDESRAKGATPILFTPIVRRKFDDNGQLVDTHGQYPNAVRQVGNQKQVTVTDLQQLTAQKVQELGVEPSKKIYLWTAPDAKFPEGRKDDTHLCREGAEIVAAMSAAELIKTKLPLKRNMLRKTIKKYK